MIFRDHQCLLKQQRIAIIAAERFGQMFDVRLWQRRTVNRRREPMA
jgi:hypothetical protein